MGRAFKLVGIHDRLKLDLLGLYQWVRDEQRSCVVALEGESGSGKTRLTQAFYESLVNEFQTLGYWRSGLEPTEVPRTDSELNQSRKRINAEPDRDKVPEWLWLAIPCTEDQSGQLIEGVTASLVPQLETHLAFMDRREARGQRLWKGVGAAASPGARLLFRVCKLVPALSEIVATVEFAREVGETPSDLSDLWETARSMPSMLDLEGDKISERLYELRRRFFAAAIEDFNARREASLPVVIVLDDAHLAHPETLRLIASLLVSVQDSGTSEGFFPGRLPAKRSVLVVLAHWPKETANAPLGAWLEELGKTGIKYESIDVDVDAARFDRPEVDHLLAEGFSELEEDQRGQIADRLLSAGKVLPHSVALVLTRLAERDRLGDLATIDEEWIGSLPLYPAQALKQRFDRLVHSDSRQGAAAQRGILLGATIGYRFPGSQLIRLTGPATSWGDVLDWAQQEGAFIEQAEPSMVWEAGGSAGLWRFESTESHRFAEELASGQDRPYYESQALEALQEMLQASLDYQQAGAWRDDFERLISDRDQIAKRLTELADSGHPPQNQEILGVAHASLVEATMRLRSARTAGAKPSPPPTDPSLQYLASTAHELDPSVAAGLAARVIYSRWLVRAGRTKEALSHLEAIRPFAEVSLGFRYSIIGLSELIGVCEAGGQSAPIELLQVLASVSPGHAAKLSAIHEESGDLVGAIDALSEWPQHQVLALRVSDLYLALNEREKAKDVLRQLAAELFWEPAKRLAALVAEECDKDQAIKLLVPVASKSPSCAVALSELYSRTGRTAEAKQAVESAAGISPQCARQLARLLAADSDLDTAITTLEYHPDQPGCVTLLVDYLEERGQETDLRQALRRLDAMATEFPRAALRKAKLLEEHPELGGIDAAIDSLEPLSDRDEASDVRLSDLYYRRGAEDDLTKSIETIEGRITQSPMCAHRYGKRGYEVASLSLDEAIDVVRPFGLSASSCGKQLLWFLLQAQPELQDGRIRIVRIAARYSKAVRLIMARFSSETLPNPGRQLIDAKSEILTGFGSRERLFIRFISDDEGEAMLRDAFDARWLQSMYTTGEDSWVVDLTKDAPRGVAGFGYKNLLRDCLELDVDIRHPGFEPSTVLADCEPEVAESPMLSGRLDSDHESEGWGTN